MEQDVGVGPGDPQNAGNIVRTQVKGKLVKGRIAQQVAVVQIQRPETGVLFHVVDAAAETHLPGPTLLHPRLLLPEGPVSLKALRAGIRKDPFHDGLVVVALAQPCHAHRLLAVHRADGKELALFIQGHHIALGSHDGVKVPGGPGDGRRLVDGLPHEIVAGGLTVSLGKVDGPRRLPAGVQNNREPVLGTQLVRQAAKLIVDPLAAVELLAVPHVHRVDDQVVVVGAGVEVGGDQHLVAVAPHAPGQFHAQLMTELRADLTGLEALVSVVGHVPIGLAEARLHGLHLPEGAAGGAVDAGDVQGLLFALFGLLGIGRVVEYGPQIGVLGLGRVPGVVHHPAQAVLNGPDLRNCHRQLPRCRPCRTAPSVRQTAARSSRGPDVGTHSAAAGGRGRGCTARPWAGAAASCQDQLCEDRPRGSCGRRGHCAAAAASHPRSRGFEWGFLLFCANRFSFLIWGSRGSAPCGVYRSGFVSTKPMLVKPPDRHPL